MEKPKILNIIIADDHPVFRRGLAQIIRDVDSSVLLKEAEDGEQVLQMVDAELPDLLVLDVDMPKRTGVEVARIVQKRNAPVKIIFLTMHKDEVLFNKAMDAGIQGFVLKENAVNDIVTALHAVVDGRYYISPSISEFLLRRNGRGTTNVTTGVANLTPAERRVLLLVAEHKTSKEIGSELGISPKTVERHRENISNKLDLHGPHALLKFAQEHKSSL